MKNNFSVKIKIALGILCMLMALGTARAKDEKRVEFSGFARAVVGYLDDESLSFIGYEDSYSFGEQSLFALRADASLTDKISVVVQAIAHSSETRDSGIQWFYLDYRPTKDWSFKLGRQRIPFFSYSDVIDVGFAYPWLTPPTPVYSTYFFSEFDGLMGRYDFANKSVSGSVAAYLGQYNGDINVSEQTFDAEVDYITGIYSTLNYDNFTFSAAYHRGKVDVETPQLDGFKGVLQMLNFNQSAHELSIKGTASFFKVGARYDSLDFFIESEYTIIDGDSAFIPLVNASYLTLGYNFSPFSAHITISHSDSVYDDPVNEIPFGFTPQLDALYFGFEQIFDTRPVDNLTSFSLGGRYDWKHNVAFKAEVSFLQGEDTQRSYFNVKDPSTSEREAVLFQLAAEWVF